MCQGVSAVSRYGLGGGEGSGAMPVDSSSRKSWSGAVTRMWLVGRSGLGGDDVVVLEEELAAVADERGDGRVGE